MRTIDDYKIVIHNGAIVVNDYDLGDCRTLENQFMIYDKMYHKLFPLAIYYDAQHKRLFLPRGVDVEFVKRKVQSTMETDLKSTIVHSREYKYYNARIDMKLPPRDDEQVEALKFILCKGNYSCYSGHSQFCVALLPGKGKTFIAACAISYLKIKTMVITSQTGILDQWKDRLQEYTTISDKDIVKLEGSATISRIINGSSSLADKSVFLCTHSTLQTYGSRYGWSKVGELFYKLGIGIKIFDEAHQCFNNMALIDFATRDVYRTYYLTATPSRSSSDENRIYKNYMKNVPSLELFNEGVDKHTGYISIQFNSLPRPSDINSCKNETYGLNHMAYIKYLMRNERFWIMFDYIFSIVVKAGGRALFYIGTNDGIQKVYDRICMTYPELRNEVGIYTSINSDGKAEAKRKKYILTTTKSAGAGEDIAHLKYSIVLAEPFKSEVLARQTLGRTRDNDTTYIELVDVGFKQLFKYYQAKKPIFNKYAKSTKNLTVDNVRLANLQEEARINRENRFSNPLEFNCLTPKDAIYFDDKLLPAIYFTTGEHTDNNPIDT